MNFDWSSVAWSVVITQGVLVFLSALIANLAVVLIGDNRVVAALLAALIFAGLFIVWNYYPLGLTGQPAATVP
jgi:hypothetical protein